MSGFNAFANLNKNGLPVDVANATPTLDIFTFLATISVTGLDPIKDSAIFTIEKSEYYGLGVASSNKLSGFLSLKLDKAAKVNVFVNGVLQRQYNLPVGKSTIDFSKTGEEVNVGFDSEIYVSLERLSADAILSEGRIVINQR